MKPLVFLPTSLCVPATMESAEDLKELFQTYELSLTVKSKPMQLPTLLRKWKRDNWMRVLCSRISSNFHFENYVEKLPFCQQVFPANPSPVLGSDKQLKTPDTSGLGSQMELALCVQNTVFLKMSQGSSVQPPQMENRYSSMSSETWNKEVINVRGVYSVRKKLALHTKGNESSSWGTPQASDHIEGARTAKESNQKCLGRDLNQMQNWPTPRAGNPGSRKPGTGGKILAEEAKKSWGTPRGSMANSPTEKQIKLGAPAKKIEDQVMCEQHNGLQDQEKSNTSGKNHGSWPTARTSDAEGGRIKTEQTEKGFRSRREKSNQYFGAKLRDAAEMEKPPTMKLNPSWVEQLMGLSTGWTDLGSWEMELSPKQQN